MNLTQLLCTDVRGTSTSDGVQLIQWSCNGGQNQQWMDN